jgi:hypothetical protein
MHQLAIPPFLLCLEELQALILAVLGVKSMADMNLELNLVAKVLLIARLSLERDCLVFRADSADTSYPPSFVASLA